MIHQYYFLNSDGEPRVINKFHKTDQLLVDGSSLGFKDVSDSDLILYVQNSYGVEKNIHFCTSGFDDRSKLSELINIRQKELTINIGVEIELYMGKPDNKENMYTCMVAHPIQEFYEDMQNKYGFIDSFHNEVGSNQMELSLRYADPLTIADCVSIVNSYLSTFSQTRLDPKPYPDHPGNGRHIHISIDGLLRGFGIHECVSLSKYLCERHNDLRKGILSEASLPRLHAGGEAPTEPTWGFGDRTAMVRIVDIETTRIEIRLGDNSVPIHKALYTICDVIYDWIDMNYA